MKILLNINIFLPYFVENKNEKGQSAFDLAEDCICWQTLTLKGYTGIILKVLTYSRCYNQESLIELKLLNTNNFLPYLVETSDQLQLKRLPWPIKLS